MLVQEQYIEFTLVAAVAREIRLHVPLSKRAGIQYTVLKSADFGVTT